MNSKDKKGLESTKKTGVDQGNRKGGKKKKLLGPIGKNGIQE